MKNSNNNNPITVKELIKKLIELDVLSTCDVVVVKDDREYVLGSVNMSFSDHVEVNYYTLDPDDEDELVTVRDFMLNLMKQPAFNTDQTLALLCDDADPDAEIEPVTSIELDEDECRVKLVI